MKTITVTAHTPRFWSIWQRPICSRLTGYGNDEIYRVRGGKDQGGLRPARTVRCISSPAARRPTWSSSTRCCRPYEGVVASSCGHVNTHEAGAIESTGHKVLTVPHRNGKLDADDLREYIETFYADESHDHMVFPGMVYISHPSEYGTLYTKNELERISAVCKAFDLPLFLDGARLGYGLTADTDVTLPDIARLTDVFYIGGTKCGALCGEAVVFTHGNMPRQFETMVKRHGAMVAKGRLNAVQFDALFTDGLYEKICAPAVQPRAQTARRSRGKGIPLRDRLPHQSAVYHRRKQQAARTRRQGRIQLYREI